jgi:deoxyribonuclease V
MGFILAIDVGYDDTNSTALAAMIVFNNWEDDDAKFIQQRIENILPYESGDFYKRELPCIINVVTQVNGIPDFIIIDGYVDLASDHPGLGRHVFNYFDGKIPVIGVAKTKFRDAQSVEILRGESKNPLFVTSAGIDQEKAAAYIKSMHGSFRIPTLLKRVDQLSRSKV